MIIAEAGVNHNGDLRLALKMVDVAANAGADVIKFQTFKTEKLVTRSAERAKYQENGIGEGSQFSMLKKLELTQSDFKCVAERCEQKNIQFMSTAFDSDSLNFLVHDLGVRTLKIPSGDVTNGPLLLQHASTHCDVILSTGMCSLADIEDALAVISFGYLYPHQNPTSLDECRRAYFSDAARALLNKKVQILHCTSEYPTAYKDVNLRFMKTLENTFGLSVGISDHSPGILVPIAATALGAQVVEKHFTLDKGFEGPDHKASLDPFQLEAMVKAVKDTKDSLGASAKTITKTEFENRLVSRKSLVAAESIKKGEKYTTENLAIKRPGSGLSPMHFWTLLGRDAKNSYESDELIGNE